MKPTCLFIVGAPGAGKTTLARHLLGQVQGLVKSPKWTVGATAVAAGHYTGQEFDGADTVPMDGARLALAYWERFLARKRRLTIFDGDRFSNKRCLNTLAGARFGRDRFRLACVHIELDEEAQLQRWEDTRVNQRRSWQRGRKTRARRFAELFGPNDVLYLNGAEEEDTLVRETRRFLGM